MGKDVAMHWTVGMKIELDPPDRLFEQFNFYLSEIKIYISNCTYKHI
jgi:hypothetical protein